MYIHHCLEVFKNTVEKQENIKKCIIDSETKIREEEDKKINIFLIKIYIHII